MTPTTSIGEVADVNPPVPTSVRRQTDALATFVPMSAVSEDGRLLSETRRPVRELLKGYNYFERGDLLLAKITPCFENGKTALVDGLKYEFGFGSTEFHVLRAGPRVLARYLYHLIRSQSFRQLAVLRMSGSAGQKRVPAEFVRRYRFVLPSLGEQRRIALILDKAEAVRRGRKVSIQMADELLRSVFLGTFGDPIGNPKRWPERAIGDIAHVITGNTPSRKRAEYYGEDIEWIKSDNINTPGHIVTQAEEGFSAAGVKIGRMAESGSTLMTCIAGSPDCIGNVALTDRRVAFNQQINAITPGESLDPAFLYVELLLSKPLIRRASTDSMKGMVSKGRLSAVRIPLPPPELQRRFGEWFRRFLHWRGQLSSAERQANDLFDSLSRDAFQYP
jgi:type I restriction enzyme S subunit